MPLPPRGNPHRVVVAAVRWLWTLSIGMALSAVSLIVTAQFFDAQMMGVDIFSPVFRFFVVPAGVYAACAALIANHRSWAALSVEWIAIVHVMLATISLIPSSLAILVGVGGATAALSMLICGIQLVALTRTIFLMERIRPALVRDSRLGRRGFEPVMAHQARAVETED